VWAGRSYTMSCELELVAVRCKYSAYKPASMAATAPIVACTILLAELGWHRARSPPKIRGRNSARPHTVSPASPALGHLVLPVPRLLPWRCPHSGVQGIVDFRSCFGCHYTYPFMATGWCMTSALEILGHFNSITCEVAHTWINKAWELSRPGAARDETTRVVERGNTAIAAGRDIWWSRTTRAAVVAACQPLGPLRPAECSKTETAENTVSYPPPAFRSTVPW